MKHSSTKGSELSESLLKKLKELVNEGNELTGSRDTISSAISSFKKCVDFFEKNRSSFVDENDLRKECFYPFFDLYITSMMRISECYLKEETFNCEEAVQNLDKMKLAFLLSKDQAKPDEKMKEYIRTKIPEFFYHLALMQRKTGNINPFTDSLWIYKHVRKYVLSYGLKWHDSSFLEEVCRKFLLEIDTVSLERKKNSSTAFPIDIWVYVVFPFLRVREICACRLINKTFQSFVDYVLFIWRVQYSQCISDKPLHEMSTISKEVFVRDYITKHKILSYNCKSRDKTVKNILMFKQKKFKIFFFELCEVLTFVKRAKRRFVKWKVNRYPRKRSGIYGNDWREPIRYTVSLDSKLAKKFVLSMEEKCFFLAHNEPLRFMDCYVWIFLVTILFRQFLLTPVNERQEKFETINCKRLLVHFMQTFFVDKETVLKKFSFWNFIKLFEDIQRLMRQSSLKDFEIDTVPKFNINNISTNIIISVFKYFIQEVVQYFGKNLKTFQKKSFLSCFCKYHLSIGDFLFETCNLYDEIFEFIRENIQHLNLKDFLKGRYSTYKKYGKILIILVKEAFSKTNVSLGDYKSFLGRKKEEIKKFVECLPWKVLSFMDSNTKEYITKLSKDNMLLCFEHFKLIYNIISESEEGVVRCKDSISFPNDLVERVVEFIREDEGGEYFDSVLESSEFGWFISSSLIGENEREKFENVAFEMINNYTKKDWMELAFEILAFFKYPKFEIKFFQQVFLESGKLYFMFDTFNLYNFQKLFFIHDRRYREHTRSVKQLCFNSDETRREIVKLLFREARCVKMYFLDVQHIFFFVDRGLCSVKEVLELYRLDFVRRYKTNEIILNELLEISKRVDFGKRNEEEIAKFILCENIVSTSFTFSKFLKIFYEKHQTLKRLC